jgi:integrase
VDASDSPSESATRAYDIDGTESRMLGTIGAFRVVSDTEVLIRMELEDNKRRRRISESEEAALLAVASPHLRSMIIAALDTGMRRGEMLALRFGDIDWTRRMITLRGATTKSRRTRLVPIGTARLLAVLGWLRLDSEGEHKADDVPVFSNEAGEALKTSRRRG